MGRLFRAFALALGLWLGASAAVPEAAHAQRIHTVKRGQTMSAIAKRHRVSVWNLALANKLNPSSRLRVGQTLEVPPRGVTYVRAGQTLSHIARKHDCTVAELKRLNRIRKNTRLRAGQRLILPGYLPEEARVRDWGKPDRPGLVKVRRREELVEVRLVDERGRVSEHGLRQLGRLMRRQDDDPVQVPHPRLALLIARISDHFGGRELTLVSGFREAGGYTRERSRHIAGRAADIRVREVPRRVLWEFCRSLLQTGCGYYPRSVFVHVDVRGRHGQWVDWSRPGKRPRYGTLRKPYTKRQRKNPKRPRVARNITRRQVVPTQVRVVDRHGMIVRIVDETRVALPEALLREASSLPSARD